MKVIAHRGYKQVTPENTMAAFAAAVAAGADMIETDIHVCKSGEIVIMHDADVSATSNGTGQIAEMTLTQLKQLDVGSWFSPAFQGQQIVTLAELVEFYQQNPSLELLLEFKGEWDKQNCLNAVELLEKGGLRHRTVLESFDTTTMANLQDVAPAYERGLLVEYPDPNSPNHQAKALDPQFNLTDAIAKCQELGVMCLNPSVRIMRDTPKLVAECHKAGLQVMVWTADQPNDFELLTNLGVDAICTNRPGFLLGWLAK